jgi:hypothetical protein
MGNTTSQIQKHFGSINSEENPRPGYYLSKSKIIYKGREIELLPGEYNFKKLYYGYAKTNIRVFYKGVPIHGANPNTFTTITRKEVKKEFNNPKLIKLNSVLGLDYILDKKRAYYHGIQFNE